MYGYPLYLMLKIDKKIEYNKYKRTETMVTAMNWTLAFLILETRFAKTRKTIPIKPYMVETI